MKELVKEVEDERRRAQQVMCMFRVLKYVYTYVRMCIRMYACRYVCLCVCAYVCKCVCQVQQVVFLGTYVCMYVFPCIIWQLLLFSVHCVTTYVRVCLSAEEGPRCQSSESKGREGEG